MARAVFICVTGMPGAGKSIIAKEIAKIADMYISMGDVVREEARKRGVGKDLESMMNFARKLREEGGKAVVAKLVIRKLKDKEGIFVIDGIRSLDEINELKKYGDVIIVAVHASPKTRFNRVRNRGRHDDPKTWDEFCQRDKKELALGIGEVIALADIMVINEDSNLQASLRNTINKVKEVIGSVSSKDRG